MKRKGFTLIELMGALVLLSLIVLVSFPAIVSVVKRSGNKIDEATKKLMISAARIKIDKYKNDYPLVDGNVFCEDIQSLIEKGYLISDLQDGSTGETIDEEELAKIMVKVEVIGSKYIFEVVEKDDCVPKLK